MSADLPKVPKKKNPGETINELRMALADMRDQEKPVDKSGVPLLIEQLGDDKFVVRDRASRILKAMYHQVQPELREALKDKDAEVRVRAQNLLSRLTEIDEERTGKLEPLIRGLGVKENITPETLPVLMDVFSREYLPKTAREAALSEIVQMGPAAITGLAVLLKHNDSNTRNAAARTLGDIGAEAKAVMPELIALVRTEIDTSVRRTAITALGDIGVKDEATVTVLIGALKDAIKKDDGLMQRNTAEALGKMGTAAKEAIPALEEILDKKIDPMDKDKWPKLAAKDMAAAALEKIDPSGSWKKKAGILLPLPPVSGTQKQPGMRK